MKRAFVPALLSLAFIAASGAGIGLWKQSQRSHLPRPGWNVDQTAFRLPNGWSVSPAGKLIKLPGDMPAAILVNPGGTEAIVNTCGYHDHSVSVVDLAAGAVRSTLKFGRSWIGLARDHEGALLVSAGLGISGGDLVYRVESGSSGALTRAGGLKSSRIPEKSQFVSSIAVARDGTTYALNIQTDEVVKFSPDGSETGDVKVGYRPYGIAFLPGEKQLVVSNWGDGSISFLDPESLKTLRTVPVGPRPCALAVAPDGKVYVANAGDVTVSVVGPEGVEVTIRTGLGMRERVGSTPVALALDPAGKRLYVANAGDNCVTVVDVSEPAHSGVLGLIPTDRYPSAVAVTPDGHRLLVGTAKGDYGPNATGLAPAEPGEPMARKNGQIYIGDQLTGRLAVIEVPDEARLREYTRQVLRNADHGQSPLISAAERSHIQRDALSKIHHVVYILKENRTYDQVFGDISKGDGEPRLTIFGEQITPNEHALVNDFVLFDNLYTDGEVSQVGHQWADAAYASDYCEKQWVLSYSGKDEVVSDKRLFASPGEYIWSQARKHHRTARVFGEYVDLQEDHNSANKSIAGHLEELGYSEQFDRDWKRGARDPEKVDEFLGEMRNAEKTGKWWDFMMMALPEDHTRGMSPGQFSPRADVASNDQAIGRLVEGISHSPFWKDTAIFVIEDDAQDGPDHVDSHRTTGLVISPYLRRGSVDSTHYSTSSMLRTMELILGLPPMTEYDALATPMYAAFTTRPDFRPFDHVAPEVDINERNPETGDLEERSKRLDFTDIDRADPDKLNHILWEAYRPGLPYPARVSTGFLRR